MNLNDNQIINIVHNQGCIVAEEVFEEPTCEMYDVVNIGCDAIVEKITYYPYASKPYWGIVYKLMAKIILVKGIDNL